MMKMSSIDRPPYTDIWEGLSEHRGTDGKGERRNHQDGCGGRPPSAERTPVNAYEATERRLYAIPDLRAKLKEDQEELEDTQKYGLKERSHSITRFFKSGVRLTPEEIMEAVIIDLEAAIAATSHELEALDKALTSIQDDPYYLTVDGKYIQRMTDNEIAEQIHCDPVTVWRNRKRLVQRVAIRLYGVEAVK